MWAEGPRVCPGSLTGERRSLGGEGKGFCPLARVALSCLAWNSEGSENSKLYLDFQVVIKLHFFQERRIV